MIRQSIKRQILGISVVLIIMMVVTSALSMLMAGKVAHYLDELTSKYVQAYSHLTRMNIRSLQQALALRQMVIAKIQVPPDESSYSDRKNVYDTKNHEIDYEADSARKLINEIIADTATDSDNAALARIEGRIDSVNKDVRRYLNSESDQLLRALEAKNSAEIVRALARIDTLRTDLNDKLENIRMDMMAQVRSDSQITLHNQRQTIIISAILTLLAAILGLAFSFVISSGITRPVRKLLDGTLAVEAGQLDGSIDVTTRDEIGQLSSAFNRMVEQLRHNERIRETFGKYIDPQVVEGLIDRPSLTAAGGQRRVMTVLFCDLKGFTNLSEGMTPQGLVSVMNHYLSTMSEPIRNQRGIIDKYIGDSIMAYWGPPFTEQTDQARLACSAAIEMIARVPSMRTEIPELLGVRSIAADCDIRIGIATGEVLVGSIGSEFMMSYTVMGDAVNLASRLEGANKFYGGRILASEATIAAAGGSIETREIDRVIVVGQSVPRVVFEIMGLKGNLSPEQQLLRSRYCAGLVAYRARNWNDARSALNSALEAVPSDGPSMTLLNRVRDFETNPPGADWDGSWHLENK